MNLSNRRFNEQQQTAYIAGWEAMVVEVEQMGWTAARDKFNLDNPHDFQPSPNAYAFACGGMDCLLKLA